MRRKTDTYETAATPGHSPLPIFLPAAVAVGDTNFGPCQHIVPVLLIAENVILSFFGAFLQRETIKIP